MGIRSPLPQYRRPQPPVPEGMNRTQAQFLELPDVTDASFLVRKLLESRARTHVGEAPGENQQSSSPQFTGSVFSHKPAWYQKRLRQLLQTLDSGTRLTESGISKFLFTRILRTSGGDLTAAAIITGNDLQLAKVKLLYACPLVSRLQTLYVQVANTVNQELWHTKQKDPPNSLQIDVVDHQIYIGSRHCPTRDAVRQAIAKLQCELPRCSATLNLQRYHNLFTLTHSGCFLCNLSTRCQNSIRRFVGDRPCVRAWHPGGQGQWCGLQDSLRPLHPNADRTNEVL